MSNWLLLTIFCWCGFGDAWCGSGCQARYGQCAYASGAVCKSNRYAHACSCVHVDMEFSSSVMWYTRLRRPMEGADRISEQNVQVPPAVPSMNGVATALLGVELAVNLSTDYAREYVYK